MPEFAGFALPDNPWALAALVIAAAAGLAYLVHRFILWSLRRAVRCAAAADRLFPLLQRYLYPLLLVVVLLFLADAAPLPPKAQGAIHQLLSVLGLVIGIVLATKGALLALRTAETRYGLFNIRGPLEVLTKIVMVAVGAMLLLDNLGISLTPILTTLGIGSLAVAIGLQDTLGNFFAGLYLKVDRPVDIGHYVKLQSGEEGYVERIGWRSTRIRMLPNNMVVVPNNKLVQDNITNYHLPDRELIVPVPVGVAYNSDLEKVERVTGEVAAEVMQTVDGGVRGFTPVMRYQSFGQSSIDLIVALRAREFTDSVLIKHEFIKRLHARYAKEGITLPYPTRTVYVKTDGDAGEAKT
ncbi:MAG TPA: mechanosensitive ion channel family protein [Candidatus Binatia bacterium]|jgi:small-conductance mechanosensitive channel|nr:mechanosensitive ion channel family protein [Candidatus Binatia bacterium]